MMTIDRDAEKALTAPHTMDCWETWAEVLIETEAPHLIGRHDEIHNGTTLMDLFHQRTADGRQCECGATWTQ